MSKAKGREPLILKRTCIDGDGYIDPSAYLEDVLAERGPLTVTELLDACCGVCTIADGCATMPERQDYEIALIDLMDEGLVVTTMPNREGYSHSYYDVIDVPQPEIRTDIPPVRMVELFAGIGAPRRAMRNLGIPHTSAISEIDKYAVMSYMAIHGDTPSLGDITKIEKLPDCDLLVYGFPCQDISIAGNRRGFEQGSGTRSSLLWEVDRLIKTADTKPETLILENVPNLVCKKNLPLFQKWIDELSSIGYTSSWAILDSRYFGIPQHRPRVFMVSSRSGRKFAFPERSTDKPMLKDVLCTVENPNAHYTEEQIERMQAEGRKDVNGEGIRQLCPRECFELSGFTSRDCYRASKVCSDSRLYSQTGNTMVVAVIQAILKGIYIDRTWKAAPATLDDFMEVGV